jgi:hypothetical protein
MASSSSISNTSAYAEASAKARQQIQNLINYIYHDRADMVIENIKVFPSSPCKTYMLTTMSGTCFLLKTSPPDALRLLRSEVESPAVAAPILDLINRCSELTPKLVASPASHPGHPLSSDFLLRGFMPGVPLSSVAHSLTTFDREQIDRSIGAVIRAVTSSRSDTFGLPAVVAAGNGFPTWRQAFQALFADALQDAEDFRLTLPYDSIRHFVDAHMGSMDGIVEARLVPLRAGTSENVLMDEHCKAVVGMVGWSDTVWGDPHLGAVFDNPSSGFWSGFGNIQALGANPEGAEIRKEM